MHRPHVRNGLGTVRPYVFGPESVLTLVQRAFGGEIVERSPGGGEVEVRIDDAMIAFAIGDTFPDGVTTVSSIYVYVKDVDAAHRLALDAGATELFAPEDKPYDERMAGVRDDFGNTWYVSTFTSTR